MLTQLAVKLIPAFPDRLAHLAEEGVQILVELLPVPACHIAAAHPFAGEKGFPFLPKAREGLTPAHGLEALAVANALAFAQLLVEVCSHDGEESTAAVWRATSFGDSLRAPGR